jgi:N-acetyl-gamma-glutamyl-phosphate reductase common form
MKRLGIIGARGYVGGELLKLIAPHPGFEVVLMTSREHGRHVREEHPDVDLDLRFEHLDPKDRSNIEMLHDRGIDAWVLALPNGHAAPWVELIDRVAPDAAIVDLSTDHRFDQAWVYGLPEMQRRRLLGARRIANPGCYATGAQLALFPILDLLDGPAHVFGVSGYSGAGTTPSPRNDPKALADNLMPYSLMGHAHEHEVRWQLGHKVHFTPHVAPFFRGIVLTVHAGLRQPLTRDEVMARFVSRYANEPLVTLSADIPLPRDAAHRHGVTLGGLAADPTESRAVIVATLDNLLKGAATQCLQNLNLACGFDELAGIRDHLAS